MPQGVMKLKLCKFGVPPAIRKSTGEVRKKYARSKCGYGSAALSLFNTTSVRETSAPVRSGQVYKSLYKYVNTPVRKYASMNARTQLRKSIGPQVNKFQGHTVQVHTSA